MGLNSALQEKMKDILFELENSAKSDEYGREILTQSLFLQFMVYLNMLPTWHSLSIGNCRSE